MTPEQRAELLAAVRQFKRERRDAKLRAGRVMPRTYRECELFLAGTKNILGSAMRTLSAVSDADDRDKPATNDGGPDA